MLSNKRGSTLVMLLLILAIMSIMGIALLNTSITENKHAIKEHDSQQAYYIAKAGADATAKYLRRTMNDSVDISNLLYNNIDDNPWINFIDSNNNKIGEFKVSIQSNPNDITDTDNLIIHSKGKFNGVVRDLKLAVSKTDINIDDVGVLTIGDNDPTTNDGIENGDNTQIVGTVIVPEDATITNPDNISGDSYYIDFEREPIDSPGFPVFNIGFDNIQAKDRIISNTYETNNGKDIIIIGNSYDSETFSIDVSRDYFDNNNDQLKYKYSIFNNPDDDPDTGKAILPGYSNLSFSVDIFDADEDGAIDVEDTKNNDNSLINYFGLNFGNITISNINDKITFELSGDMNVQFGNLKMSNSPIDIKGTGLLTMYVNEFGQGFGDINVIDDTAQLLIIYTGTNPIEFKTSSGPGNDAFLYAPQAQVIIKNDLVFRGAIVCRDLILNQTASVIFEESIGEFPEHILMYEKSFEIKKYLGR